MVLPIFSEEGGEYDNIMPIWEWDKIPGVTNRDYAKDRPMSIAWGEAGNTSFSGGVSDGIYGVSGYELNYDSVCAKKAWFLFDKEIVCLGSGINSEQEENITTTVNQCWMNGKVFTARSKKGIGKNKVIQLQEKGKTWVLHDSIGYIFPKGGNVSIAYVNQTGSWNQINRVFPDQKISGDVFKLWIDHGVKPVNANYAYVVLPGVQTVKEMRKFDAGIIEIIANSDSVQAVLHKKLNMIQVVFYRPCTVQTAARSIAVNKPCILMIRNINAGNQTISVADPGQKEEDVTIHFIDLKTKKQQYVKIDLPNKEMAGSTISKIVEMN